MRFLARLTTCTRRLVSLCFVFTLEALNVSPSVRVAPDCLQLAEAGWRLEQFSHWTGQGPIAYEMKIWPAIAF